MDETETLFKLYEIAIAEYRFQVQLNDARTRFYLGFNPTLIAAAAGLFRFVSGIQAQLIATGIFVVGLFLSIAGLKSLIKGHEYYRRTNLKKSQLEIELGILGKGAETTAGMREARAILQNPDAYVSKPLRVGTIDFWQAWVFRILIALNLLGFLLCFVELLQALD